MKNHDHRGVPEFVGSAAAYGLDHRFYVVELIVRLDFAKDSRWVDPVRRVITVHP
jgi:hypothetical protein